MNPNKTFDQERISFNLARLKRAGGNYELVVDPDVAVSYKEGADVDIKDVLKAEEIFFDAKKGELASEERMKEVFGTDDVLKIAAIILKEGEIQLTAEHRAKVRENKRKVIVQLIARNACDPKTRLPHPLVRIENAMEEARIRIDEFKRPEDQLSDVIKELRVLLPISIETREAFVHIPAMYTGRAHGVLQQLGKLSKEEWKNDGSLECVVTLPAGMLNEFIDKVNGLTHGDATVDMLK